MTRFDWSWLGFIMFCIGGVMFAIAFDLSFWQQVLATSGVGVMAVGVNS